MTTYKEKNMTIEEITSIEEELKTTFPEFYKQFLLDFPQEFIDKSVGSVFFKKEEFLSGTNFMREYEPNFPSNSIAIGTNGADHYCVLSNELVEKIYFWSHEEGGVDNATYTIEEFLEYRRIDFDGFDDDF